MLYNCLYPLAADFGPFNIFRYITFRTAAASLSALAISLVESLLGRVGIVTDADVERLSEQLLGPLVMTPFGIATLGLAAANALTAWIYRRCRYEPPPAGDSSAAFTCGRSDRFTLRSTRLMSGCAISVPVQIGRAHV